MVGAPGTEESNKQAAHRRRNNYGLLGFIGSLAALYCAVFRFPYRWFLSGAPVLTGLLLAGSDTGSRLPAIIPITINLLYAVASTSWLLYWVFTSACYPITFVLAMYQFDVVARPVRRVFRKFLRDFHFTADKIAFFDLPALEINTEVDGLMVIRGVIMSLSSLTIVAHGIEVGIKLSDDLELAIQTDKVTVRLFRGIDIGDVYANVKGGEYEMTFGKLDESTDDPTGDALMNSDTPLLKAAAAAGDIALDNKTTMKNRMTNKVDGTAPKNTSAEDSFDSMKKFSPDDERAMQRYKETVDQIEFTSKIRECSDKVKKRVRSISSDGPAGFDYRNENDMRAAVCSALHDIPSIPHPPKRSIKVTTLQNLSSPRTRKFLHRLPLLLRLLLNPLSYLHDIKIASVTAAGSGKWIEHMLREFVFKRWAETDAELSKLEKRVASWLSDANFVVELTNITALAQVPVATQHQIRTQIRFDDVMAYRTVPKEILLKQVMRLAGADAEFGIPSYLLPHHEHLLPPVPTEEDEQQKKKDVANADGRPNEVHAEAALEQARKDEANVKMWVRVKLPAVFDQEVLDWTAAMIKLSKLVELEHNEHSIHESRGLKELGKALHLTVKDSMKRVAVDAVANDRWIAKLVGKVTKKLEVALGDVGYSGDIPVALQPYRDVAEKATKLLP